MTAKLDGMRRLVGLGLPVPPFGALELASDGTRPSGSAVDRCLAEVGRAPGGYSVRSAASDEDTSSSSAAGRYRSFNGLGSRTAVIAAIDEVQRHHAEASSCDSRLSVILQATHVAACSGVVFSFTDDSGSAHAEIEAYFGGCSAVTDGLVPPYRFAMVDGELRPRVDDTRGFFRFTAHALLFDSDPRGCRPGALLQPALPDWPAQIRMLMVPSSQEVKVYGYRDPVPPPRIWAAASAIVALAERLPPGDHDLEWGATADGEVMLYQWRPITALPGDAGLRQAQAKSTAASAAAGASFAGLPASRGSALGTVAHPADCTEGDILMLREATVHDVRAIESSGGVVTSIGGLLSHVAIICRELGKPCVTGIGEILSPGTAVKIDGDRGVVEVLSR